VQIRIAADRLIHAFARGQHLVKTLGNRVRIY
jgi:hypothetical protein